jgi:hypothetical protein
MSQIPPDPRLKAIERALGDLVPRSSRLDRDDLMFRAGTAAAAKPAPARWLWPGLSATLALALAAESTFLGLRPVPAVIERSEVVRKPAPAARPDQVSTHTEVSAARPAPRDDEDLASSERDAAFEPSWAVDSDYRRLQSLVLTLGIDALPERTTPRLSGSEAAGASPDRALMPAGVWRDLELEKLFKPGGPS